MKVKYNFWLIIYSLIFLTITFQYNTFPQILEKFDSSDNWKVIASDGVILNTETEKGFSEDCIKLSYDFTTGAGYCGIQKKIPLKLPENFEFSFYIKGNTPINNLEFKLLDSSGENVWWYNQRNYEMPNDWTKITVKKRHIEFAWGPTENKNLQNIDKIEFTVASSSGGKGIFYIDELKFKELDVNNEVTSTPDIYSRNNSDNLKFIFDNKKGTLWKSNGHTKTASIILDFKKTKEYGGLIIDWDTLYFAKKYNVLISDDSLNWANIYSVSKGKGGRSYIFLKDASSQYIKLDMIESNKSSMFGIREIEIKKIDFSKNTNYFFSKIAEDLPCGFFPKYNYNRQSYWTITGVNSDTKESLINEEGMVEIDKSRFSIEPFLYINNKFITWNDIEITQGLEKEYLPIPSVKWNLENIEFETKIFADGNPNESVLYISYNIKNKSDHTQSGNLYLAIRPFQVNPPWQFLNWPGGTAKINNINSSNNKIIIDDKVIYTLSKPEDFGAIEFDEGIITEFLSKDKLPQNKNVKCHFGYAEGALKYSFNLKPNDEKKFYLAVPFHKEYELMKEFGSDEILDKYIAKKLTSVANFWDEKISHVKFNLPQSADKLINSVRSNLAYILINRDNFGIQPGSRSYERSWIRDGALTSSALLKMGIKDEVKEFLNWYSQYQFKSGKVPCVVDTRGPDPVPENDSHGQLIYAILQYYHFTKDSAFLKSKFNNVKKAVEYIEYLVSQRTTDEYKNNDELKMFYGLMPESISHEGYSAKPMHSYWDDFFGLKGLKDAVTIAQIINQNDYIEDFTTLRDNFQENLYNSINASIQYHGINYIPGCAELGDFDATSTTIALNPCNELKNLPKKYLINTFDKYFENFNERLNPQSRWINYTPYEQRVVGSYIYLNHINRAHKLLDFFFTHQRPLNWNHWAEVVWNNRDTTEFIGDMPHTWVGSDFINSVRSMFVYEDEYENSLIVGAGLYDDWIINPNGMEIENLPTYHGELSYSIHPNETGYKILLGGDIKMPQGNIKIKIPYFNKPKSVIINGKELKSFNDSEITISEFPALINIKLSSEK